MKEKNTEVVTQNWTRYINKDLMPVFLNMSLAIVSVLLIGPWIDFVMLLETQSMVFNFLAVITAGITLFISKTHYNKGAMNVLKKILFVTGLSGLTIYFSYMAAGTFSGLLYPLSGVFIMLVAFYMISLSTETLGLIGISALTMLLGTAILGGFMFNHIDIDTAINSIKGAMLLILALGGILPKIRMYLHGIRGTNNDGGFGRVGDDSDDFGDDYDGDGDTGDE